MNNSSIVKVGAVSYSNTLPLLYGLNSLALQGKIELMKDYPSAVAAQLIAGTVDVGLVPVAVLPLVPNGHIIGDYGIAAHGKVASVCVFSEVPMEQIETVLLDYQSRTSVALAQLLFQHFWKQPVQFVPATPGFEQQVSGTTAAVVIGDRALSMQGHYPYIFDLAEAWLQWTGLPFVFAAWIANKPLSEDFIASFNAANAAGMQELESIAASYPFPAYDLLHYFTVNVHYLLTKEKRAGMQLFLQCLQQPANASVLVQQATTSILK
ncbi:MAG: menaquinone biosynthesis protein [Bacteroidetes bacterium]|uniref:menaquinone biosynthetic enzyme MqnA/MqnD family protein n=1 Tax=Phnomibacter sp. TaxID=2836217 RepID=UPI002FDED767|nr:menaquinone biosynthesis protein [Bacteroidota bacterium]